MCTTLKGSYLKMGDKDNSVTMEPLLSPTKSGKAKVKAARFQVKITQSWKFVFTAVDAGGKRRCRGCRGGGSSRSRQ